MTDPSVIDINTEMRKQPEDRAPGTDEALLCATLDFARSTGVVIPKEIEDELISLL